MREQLLKGPLGYAVPGVRIDVVEQLVEGLLGMAEGALRCGDSRSPNTRFCHPMAVTAATADRSCWNEA